VTWFRARGATAMGFCADAIPEQYRYLSGSEYFTDDPAIFQDGNYDLVAVFDAGDLVYAGVADFMPHLQGKPRILNIDHHITNRGYGDINVIDPKASSTAEVLTRLFLAVGDRPDPRVATCLLTGILTDTNGFTNAATTESALNAAAELLRLGAKITEPVNRTLRNRTLASLRLWGLALSRLKHDAKSGLSSTAIFQNDLVEGGDDEQAEGIANFLNTFLETSALLVLKEVPGGKVKGSLRTVGDLDVSAIATALGGGGHKKAAGFTIDGRLTERDYGWVLA